MATTVAAIPAQKATTAAAASPPSPSKSCVEDPEVSPRTTVVLAQPSSPMTTNVSVMNESAVAPGNTDEEGNKKTSPNSKEAPASSEKSASNPASPEGGGNKKSAGETSSKGDDPRKGDDSRLTPNSQQVPTPASSQLTPQPQAGSAYYIGGYPSQSQVTPEPPSPAHQQPVAYADAASFFQQPGAFAAPNSAAAFGAANTPLSPPRVGVPGAVPTTPMGVAIPPASPLFPRVSSGGGLAADGSGRQGAPPSPNLPYMSAQLGAAGMYHQYPVTTTGSQSSDSPEDASSWNDRYVSGVLGKCFVYENIHG